MKTELIENGYKLCAPNGEAGLIDRKISTESKCPDCGAFSLIYQPYTKFNESGQMTSYRAFAICENCGYEIEF